MNPSFYTFITPIRSSSFLCFQNPFDNSFTDYYPRYSTSNLDSKDSLPDLECSITVIVLMALFPFITFFLSPAGVEIRSVITSIVSF